MKVIRANCEEIHIQGPEGPMDVRVTNSYPSKVKKTLPLLCILDIYVLFNKAPTPRAPFYLEGLLSSVVEGV